MPRHHVVGMWSLLVLLQMINNVSAMAVNMSMTPPVNVRQASCKLPWVEWSGSDLHCYYFSGKYASYTWYEAEQECVQQGIDDGLPGSHLVSVHSAAEENFINTWFGWTSAKVYFGLQQSAVGSPDYRWSDGTQLVYTNWEVGEPDSGDAVLQCSVFDRDGDKWHDEPCTDRINSNYVCKAGTAVTTPAPTTRTPGCPVPWVSWRDHCYLFYNDAVDRTWTTAQDACVQFGARDGLTGSNLASIHSDDEDLFINSYYAGVSNTPVWIGLQQTQAYVNDFKWVDGTPTNYDAWYTNQPDNYDDGPSLVCVSMLKQTTPAMADWWDNFCTNAYKHFVCKSYLEGSTGTTSTTTTTTTTTTTPTTITTSSTASSTTTTTVAPTTASTPSTASTAATTPSTASTTASTPSTASTAATTPSTASTAATTPSTASTSTTTPSSGSTSTTTPATGSTSTTPSPPSDGSSTTPPQGDGSGGGGVAGIIVGVVMGVGVIIVGVLAWRRKESIKSALQSKPQTGGKDVDTTSLGGNSMATTSSTTQILPSSGISFNHGTNAAMYFSNPESDA